MEKEIETIVHIRVIQRNGRKWQTIVEGLDAQVLDLVKISTHLKKKLCCGCTLVDNGQVLQIQGDHRKSVYDFLKEEEIHNNVKVH